VVKRFHIVRALLADTLAELSADKVMEVLPLGLRLAVGTDAYMVNCYADRLYILGQCRNEGERKDYVFSLAMMNPKMTDGDGMKSHVARRLSVARTRGGRAGCRRFEPKPGPLACPSVGPMSSFISHPGFELSAKARVWRNAAGLLWR